LWGVRSSSIGGASWSGLVWGLDSGFLDIITWTQPCAFLWGPLCERDLQLACQFEAASPSFGKWVSWLLSDKELRIWVVLEPFLSGFRLRRGETVEAKDPCGCVWL
jgi:hypothetical protein